MKKINLKTLVFLQMGVVLMAPLYVKLHTLGRAGFWLLVPILACCVILMKVKDRIGESLDECVGQMLQKVNAKCFGVGAFLIFWSAVSLLIGKTDSKLIGKILLYGLAGVFVLRTVLFCRYNKKGLI